MKTQQKTISEVRLVYRIKIKASEGPQIKCSKDAFDLLMKNWDPYTIEHFPIDVNNKTNSLKTISQLHYISKHSYVNHINHLRISVTILQE
jgi:hypothetical protein